MEGEDSLLDTLFDEGDAEDVEMLDVEEGELTEQFSNTEVRGDCDGGNPVNQESNVRNRRNRKKKKNKKKNKRKGSNDSTPNLNNINRFVLDACKHLQEKKSYLLWTAVGCLGVSALSDLIKEVDAIQACGGQKTIDGTRFRTGGGILWNIIKVRDPNAYKEIMTKGREFEKQFKQQLTNKQEASAQSIGVGKRTDCDRIDAPDQISQGESQPVLPSAEKKCPSVHDRLRMQVTYDDLLEGDDQKD